ncbi:hypothetical protein [Elizabethkingia anophelis]|uniref:hypothetical protein n=1 Tax=Elizabethkingia anophelis TaxID=1117645 RepID=UPI00259B6C98|nr:hypothetical protein [Elizabethkingia anophelis]WJK01646.1 hypothetical protein QTN78_07910 [Elizabethkingia anophelis]
MAFFDPNNPEILAQQMMKLIQRDYSFLKEAPEAIIENPVAYSWEELFQTLLSEA